jgi:hypothetical protein
MKRVLMLFAMVLAWVGVSLAQESGQVVQQLLDVIYKSDGSVVKGVIMEQIPGVSYTITTTDGKSLTIDALSIDKITKEPALGGSILTENINHNYYYNPYLAVRYDENGNPILPLSPTEAMFGSLIVPGLGQIFNGQHGKGLALMGGALAGVLAITAGTAAVGPRWEDVMGYSGLALLVGSYLYSLIDAPLYAKRWNVEHGFPANGNLSMSVAPVIMVPAGYYGAPRATVGVGAEINF